MIHICCVRLSETERFAVIDFGVVHFIVDCCWWVAYFYLFLEHYSESDGLILNCYVLLIIVTW